ncbi:RxLR effector protein [Phytophthora megakarya]|uniref:RxLR effector protein n=1 Tax=Phytophthora megakarya TaxID=4795 RepID=A0A225V6E6_9STRA|nr:RxLR effector protein [Phytophthora megakarya]
MRFSIFFTLLVTTFIACCPSFASAEDVVNDVEVRRLRLEAVPVPAEAVKAVANPASVQAVKAVANPASVQAVMNAGNNLNERLFQMRAFKQIMAANGDEVAIKAAMKMVANTPKVSEKNAAKFVSEAIVQGVKKNPKSWPRLKKFAMITLGAQVGALAVYGAYKLLTKDNSAAVTTTTTTGSA